MFFKFQLDLCRMSEGAKENPAASASDVKEERSFPEDEEEILEEDETLEDDGALEREEGEMLEGEDELLEEDEELEEDVLEDDAVEEGKPVESQEAVGEVKQEQDEDTKEVVKAEDNSMPEYVMLKNSDYNPALHTVRYLSFVLFRDCSKFRC